MKWFGIFLLALLYASGARGQNSVQSFSFDGTGLTPSTPQFGFIVAGGSLNATHGGTGQTGYAIGNLLYASSPTALAKLPIGTNGYVLTVSGGLPAWLPNSAGSGTVTSVSVVTANGFAGTVATATTTPAITLTTSINAPLLAGNGTAIAAATTTGSGSTAVLSSAPVLSTSLGLSDTLNSLLLFTIANSSTGGSSQSGFTLNAGGRAMSATVDYTGLFFDEGGFSGIATRYSDFDTHIWRSNGFVTLMTLSTTLLTLGVTPKFDTGNTTGAGTALLGANSPAVTNTSPFTWLTVTTSDGSTGYIPVWK